MIMKLSLDADTLAPREHIVIDVLENAGLLRIVVKNLSRGVVIYECSTKELTLECSTAIQS